MKITVRKFTAKDIKIWDEFVSQSNNGTIFHTRKFLSYHQKNRFLDHSLLFYKKGKLICLLPSAYVINNGLNILESHPGASVGSLITSEKVSFLDSLKIVEALSNYGLKNNFDKIKITQPPIIYSKQISQYIDFAFRKSNYYYLKREISSILFLEDSIENNLLKFKSSHRTAIRKAEKSAIDVKIVDDFKSFYIILKNNLEIRHNVQPTHSLEELLKLKKLFPDKINLFAAYLNDKMIGGVINFILNKKVILAFYISHDKAYQELRPINLIFYKTINWAIQNKFKVYDFGIFSVNEKPNMGLARFKENFGACGIFRNTLELTLS